MLVDFATVLVFIVLGAVTVFLMLAISRILARFTRRVKRWSEWARCSTVMRAFEGQDAIRRRR